MSILYTPAGDTDPIRDCYDGAMLHIIRTYRPQYVRIFLSAEMSEKEKNRHIYSKAIEYNVPECKFDFIYTDIVNVQLMEELVPLAEGFLELRKEFPEEEILLNLSSGTPQMKTVMSFLATDFENVRAIQVDSPQRASNRTAHATQDNEDIDVVIENNFDNVPDYTCRCHEAPLSLLRRYSIRHQLISLINNYEYRAALTMYNKNKAMFVDETGKLLRHADLRSKLLINEAFKGMGKENIYNDNSVKKLNEFLMVMELHQRKGELAEFIPKLTPFLYELLLYYLENHVTLKPESFCYSKRNNNSSWKISAEKLRKEAPDVFTYLNYYFRQGFRDTELSFSNMLLILESLKSVKTELMGELQILREVEKNQRNKIAHTILTDVTEENLQAIEPKLSSYQIIQHLRKAFLLIMEGESICKRNVYDDLNRRIVDSLNEFNK